MRKAKIGTRAGFFALAAFLAGFAIASCGGKIDPNSTFDGGDGSASDYPDVFNGLYAMDATTFDAGFITPVSPDGAPPYPPVDNGPTNAACLGRSRYDCCTGEDCANPADVEFARTVKLCLENGGYVCNWVYVDFDSDGCAIDLRALDPNDSFVKCMTMELNAARWMCEQSGQLSTYVDCTTP